MSNHVHLIAKAADPERLQDVMRDHKKYTAVQLIKAIGRSPRE